ncbi:MAG: hypothetical protein HC853_01110 [Anaerolineae bacterium]|nr:hypothetical protein [Anaerolineae bacterium]
MAKKKIEKEEEYVGLAYAAVRLKVYPHTVRRYYDRGILSGRKLPLGRRQISKRSLEALLARIKQGEKVEA